ncbi:flotillin family protein [Carnobacterium jeotgali]|uniref:flotillin family protein n=1 Tax=Carnobacterium jeotgali TaxID=545534 RepID=UPI000492FEB4|nr:SPFH domain-containing protein [Carnobacterium jeotgali]
MNSTLFATVGAVVIAVVLLVALVSRYRTASPAEALIISGTALGDKNVYIDPNTGNKMKIVSGGGTFVWPIIQSVHKLSLLSSKLDVRTPEVYTEEGVPVAVDGTVIIKIGSNSEDIATAAEQYLGKSTEQLESEAREVLEGHLRSILGRMTVEDIYQNRDKFNQNVQDEASGDLAKMGLVILSFTVKEVTDKNGYLDSLGQGRIAEVKRDADIKTANADKETRIQRALAEQLSQEAELQRQTEIAEAEKVKSLRISEYGREQNIAKAEAESAYDLKKAELKKKVIIEEGNAQIIEREKQIELQEKETIKQEREYDATVRKKADAERYSVEQRAEADKNKAIAESEARAKEIELNGMAQAESIRLIGKAEADSKTAWAEALKQYGDEAIATLLIEAYPAIVRAAAEPLGNIDKITVVDSGNGNGASAITKTALNTLAASQEAFKNATGLDINSLISSFAGTKNVGRQINNLNDTLSQTTIVAEEPIITDDSEKII